MDRYTQEHGKAKAELIRIAILHYVAYRGMKNTLVNAARPEASAEFMQLISDILEECDLSIKYAESEMQKAKNKTDCKEVCDNGTK